MPKRNGVFSLMLVAPLSALFVGGGCKERGGDVQSYAVPKETAPPTPALTGPAPGAAAPGAMEMTSDGVALPPPAAVEMAWDLPDGWSLVDNQVPMRFATLVAGSADDPDRPALEVSITQLGGMAGGVGANVNRWLSQIGLPAANEAELIAMSTPIESAGAIGVMVDLHAEDASGEDLRMLAAIFPGGEATWFIKATATFATLAAHRDGFEQLCHSVRFDDGTSPGTAAGSGAVPPPPSSTPDVHDPDAPVAWDALPTGWTLDPTPATMSVASMTIAHGGQSAFMTITPLGGSQDALANVNRWRRQVGLAPAATMAEAGVSELTVAGESAQFVDVQGGDVRTLAVMTVRDGTTWFFKLTGPDAAVAPQRAVFEAFVRSVHFHDQDLGSGG